MVIKPSCKIYDIDECVFHFLPVLLKLHNSLYSTNYRASDIKEWQLPDDLYRTYKQYEQYIYAKSVPKAGAREALLRDRQAGYQIVLMTARSSKFRHETIASLRYHDIISDEVFFNKNKSLKINRLFKQYKPLTFVDDKLETVEFVKAKTRTSRVYLMDMPSNSDRAISEGIIRVSNLMEVV